MIEGIVGICAAFSCAYILYLKSRSSTRAPVSSGERESPGEDIILHAGNLTKLFEGVTAVENVSFDVRRGEIFGFLGPNGAGKTTTVRMLCGEFMIYFLMIPAILPMMIATSSIIGEKELKSLEPLLATPISTIELLLGKSIAALMVPVFITWLSYLLLVIITFFIVPSEVFYFIVSPVWILGMLTLSPLLSWFSVLIGIIISSRVNDFRIAQQIGGVIVLPLVAAGMLVLMGKIYLTPLHMIMTGIMLLALDMIVFTISIDLFERETILTRWR